MSTTTVRALAPRRPKGYVLAHHNGSGFKNPWPSYQGSTVASLIRARWNIPKNFVPVPADRTGLVGIRKPDFGLASDGLKATWIGHASFLIETTQPAGNGRGMRILLDPVWSDRVGPYGVVGPVRFTPPPCTIEDLPPIDVVCISHDHYDHLDSYTLKKLNAKQNGNLRLFCSLGVKAVVLGLGIGIKAEQITEADWWDGFALRGQDTTNVEIICTPAQHRSGRTPWSFDGTLWCSWVINEPGMAGKRLFFAGDTGYCHVSSDDEYTHAQAPHPPCPIFKDIGELYGPFDLALVPVGCYKPRSILSGQHSSPEDSIAIHHDVKSKKSIGMHYGSFRGGFSAQYEPVTEPPERWRKAAEAGGLTWGEDIGLCDVGETVIV